MAESSDHYLPEGWRRADAAFEARMRAGGVGYLATDLAGVRFIAPLGSADPGGPVTVIPAIPANVEQVDD